MPKLRQGSGEVIIIAEWLGKWCPVGIFDVESLENSTLLDDGYGDLIPNKPFLDGQNGEIGECRFDLEFSISSVSLFDVGKIEQYFCEGCWC